MHRPLAGSALALVIGLLAVPSPGAAQHWIAFRAGAGWSGPVRGNPDGVGSFLAHHIAADYAILFKPECFRGVHFGVGFGWATYPVLDDVRRESHPELSDATNDWNAWNELGRDAVPDTLKTWNVVGGFLLVGYQVEIPWGFRPYGELRVDQRRFRSERARWWEVDSNNPKKSRNFWQAAGTGVGGAVGVNHEAFIERVYLDLSLRFSDLGPESLDLREFGFRQLDGGTLWGVHLSILWYP